MTENIRPETLRQQTILLMDFRTAEEAVAKYAGLPEQVRQDMANVYQQAFGGKPWYERCACQSCGTFEKDTTCSRCGTQDLPPAYPTEELINAEFPSMVASFVPGALVLACGKNGSVNGFCAGGMTTPEALTEKKYKGNRLIGQSIMTETGLLPGDRFFYENEMCVLPELQGKGIGSDLNRTRLAWIRSQNIGVILGRTINPNLLKMKAKQFPEFGYSMNVFTPVGDAYKVNGLQRQCYFAVRAG